MIFNSGETILFIGDSITDADRRGLNAPYGAGYMLLVRDFITARYPERRLTFVNEGVSGDTSRHLRERWQRDVLRQAPTWLSIMIGINDVWRSFKGKPAEAVSLAEYEGNLRALLEQTRVETGARFILATPYLIEPDRTRPMRAMMDRYGEVVKRLAAEYNAILVDTQAAFDEALRATVPEAWAADQVHPNGAGHAVIALAFLRALGFHL